MTQVRRLGILISALIPNRAMLACAVIGVATPGSPNVIDHISSSHNADLAALPADHPLGTKATVTLVSLEQTLDLHNPTVSTFIVDYAPGGSAVLHRAPSSGYVLVHVLSGAITAWAWKAGVGFYRAGETWAEPAFAYDIATRNASTHKPARALVVLITREADSAQQQNSRKVGKQSWSSAVPSRAEIHTNLPHQCRRYDQQDAGD
jgi:quercetin dioxygenase-like cupin family protein